MATEKSPTAGIPIRCKAAVCRKSGEPLVIEEILVAPPNRHEVRIRIICTSVCQSDITFWKLKDFPAVFPRVLGHEAIGVVESVGEDVEELKEGDIVIPTFMSDCGDCADCKSKKSNLCSKLPFKVINEMTGGGADYCFECVGLASLVHEAYSCCRKGWGKTIVLGVDKPGAQLSLSSFDVLHHGKILTGSLFGGLKAKSDIPFLLKRYMDKVNLASAIISFPLFYFSCEHRPLRKFFCS